MHQMQQKIPVVPRGGAKTIARIQAASGLVFGVFLVLHLIATISGVAGIAAYDRTLAVIRNLYRPNVAIEFLLIGLSGSVHIGCGVRQMAKRQRLIAVRGSSWLKAHRLSGYFLLVTVVGHAVATRIGPTFGAGSTATGAADFAYLAYSVLGWPWFFWPYYVLLGMCGAIHLGLGVHLALRILIPRRIPAGAPSRGYLLGVGAFVLVAAMGVVAIAARSPSSSRQRFTEYRQICERFAPFIARHRADEASDLR